MATSQGSRQIGTNRLYWCSLVVFFVANTGISGCAYSPPKDTNGNLPDDVVRKFVELVQARDYQSAERLWYGESKLVFKPSSPKEGIIDLRIKFEDFCARYLHIDLASASISKPEKGKSGFSMVNVDWKEDGAKKHDSFGLKIIQGEWKMQRGYRW
jgi:hypothetical protein